LSKIIPGDDLAACQPWLVPDMGRGKTRAGGPLTAGQMEALHEQARAEGYQQGLDEGRAAGATQMQSRLKQLGDLIAGLANPVRMLDGEIESQVAELAMLVARQLVRRELKLDPSQVIGVVRETLGLLPVTSRQIRLMLHPDDAALVRDALSVRDTVQSVLIVDDPVQQRGGCRVVTDTSRIDATVEARVNAVIAHVLGGERSGDE